MIRVRKNHFILKSIQPSPLFLYIYACLYKNLILKLKIKIPKNSYLYVQLFCFVSQIQNSIVSRDLEKKFSIV
jgi:hypothetical protein